jgi:ribose transport system substrate-binding protein
MIPRRKNQQITVAVAGLTTAAALLTGCAAGSSPAGSSNETPKIGFSVQKLTDPFQLAMIDHAKKDAVNTGVELMEPANANSDPAKQTTDMQTILTQSPQAIIVGPVDAKAIVPSITKANQENVPIIAIDQAPGGGKVAMVVRADNVGMGVTACESMGKLLGGKGTVLELQGDLASSNGLDRSNGFGTCMKDKFPDIRVMPQPTDWKMDKATAAVQTIASNQQVDGIFLASDFFIPGVEKTLKSLGKWAEAGQPGHISIVGIDGTSEALELIRTGYIDGTVSQPANAYAEWAVKYAAEAAKGTTFSEGKTDHDSTIVKVETGLADLLPAPLVTKENVDDSTLWGNAK